MGGFLAIFFGENYKTLLFVFFTSKVILSADLYLFVLCLCDGLVTQLPQSPTDHWLEAQKPHEKGQSGFRK